MVGKSKVENARIGDFLFDDWKLFRIPGLGSRVFRQGFTLLELLVVMLIIGILAGLGAHGYRLARRSALEGRAKAEIEVLRSALEEYRVEYGTYPDPLQTDVSFEEMFSGMPSDQRELMEDAVFGKLEVLDPWGHPYHYSFSNRFQYSIWSDGVDTNTTADDIDPSRAGY